MVLAPWDVSLQERRPLPRSPHDHLRPPPARCLRRGGFSEGNMSKRNGETKKADPSSDIRRVAREKFGYDDLRPGQEEVIRLILDKHDTLSVMPTGSGKSAIYQI